MRFQPIYCAKHCAIGKKPRRSREKLKAVATYLRVVNMAVLPYLINIVLLILVRAIADGNQLFAIAVFLLQIFTLLLGLYYFVRLTNSLLGTVFEVFFGIGLILPCISLICLLVISSKVASYLKSHGVNVGFLGGAPNLI